MLQITKLTTKKKKTSTKMLCVCVFILWLDSAIYDSLAPLFYCPSTLNANIYIYKMNKCARNPAGFFYNNLP